MAAVKHDRDISILRAHRVRFTRDAFDPSNPALADALAAEDAHEPKLMAVIDRGFAERHPRLEADLRAYLAAHRARLGGLRLVGCRAVPGGEDVKNDLGYLEGLLGDIYRQRLDRKSVVLAIGGGAVLDMVGFAAAVSHRGVRLVRMPTTTLAQCDSGVGVKNGVNMFGAKNMIGTFAVPWAVVNDLAWLRSLPMRDWRCGLAEAVKVALLKDPALFDQIATHADKLATRDEDLADTIWQRSAELHLDHIARGGDPFEDLAARPLDFGHWAAHQLEPMSGWTLRHGEAVAIGLAIDCHYAARVGLLAPAVCDRVVTTLEALGFSLDHDLLDRSGELMQGLEAFREHLGGELTITLIRGVGEPVDVHVIGDTAMRDAIAALRPSGTAV